MSDTINIRLTDSEDAVLKESEKRHCFFVGKTEDATNAGFEKAYEITHVNWPQNLFASYEIGGRQFTDLSFTQGSVVAHAKGSYKLKKHPDGTAYLHMALDYPVHDTYERMYSQRFERVIYKENGEVIVLQAKHGRVLPKINVFVGLKDSVPYLDRLLEILDNADAAQTTRMRMLSRCVAQKYRLSEETAEQLEKFVIYTCLDAANISASFGIFKSKKRTLSYELLKATADYVCGTCSPEWYSIAPRRRYERLSDSLEYIRHLQRGKYVEWSNEEKALCRSARKWIDASVFADVYAVSLVLLRFLAENSFTDVYSFKTTAVSPGIFSSTLMADTVDRFSAAQLDGEAKKVFFSLVGKDPANVKTRVERALYRYHAASNYLFRTAQALTAQSGLADTKRQAQVLENEVEHIALSCAAKAALFAREKSDEESMQNILVSVCEKVSALYGIHLSLEDEQETLNAVAEKLKDISADYLEEETAVALSGAGKIASEIANDFVPENAFVFTYVATFILLRMLQYAFATGEEFCKTFERSTDSILGEEIKIKPEELKTVILEAKYRYGAMCGADLLETMAN